MQYVNNADKLVYLDVHSPAFLLNIAILVEI